MLTNIKSFIKKEFPKEEKVIYIAFGIWFIFLVFSFIFSSGFETKYEWLGKINPGTWGDSFGVLNSLISVITFFLVYKTFGLQKEMLESQKKELEATREEMRGQKEIMQEQRFQDTFSLLLKTSQEHINSLVIPAEEVRKDQSKITPTIPLSYDLKGGMAIRYLLTGEGKVNAKRYVTNGVLGNFKKYINTLGNIEEFIINADSSIKKDFFIKLAKTQINNSEIRLYNQIKPQVTKGEFFELTIFNIE